MKTIVIDEKSIVVKDHSQNIIIDGRSIIIEKVAPGRWNLPFVAYFEGSSGDYHHGSTVSEAVEILLWWSKNSPETRSQW